MINDQVQKQQAGDNSTNYQAQSIVIQGISYSDAKEIALDVYKSNYLQLSYEAAELAKARAEELTDDFLIKLKEENEEAINQMKQPAMQSALYEAQKQYAKTGDKDLEELLVDILVERALTTERNIHQIVLDEALSIASKLTSEQMDTLTINFLISQTHKYNLINLETLINYFNTEIIPFTKYLTDSKSCYEHLVYAGCISLMETSYYKAIPELMKERYPTLFSKGFTEEDFKSKVDEHLDYSPLVIKCFHYVNLIQFKAMDINVLEKMIQENNISEENRSKIIALFNSIIMSTEEVKMYLIEQINELAQLFELWDSCTLSKFNLTTVGIAIAQANYRRRTGLKLDLKIWVK
jgi:hypothetical protein